jgi:hypothetical protein
MGHVEIGLISMRHVEIGLIGMGHVETEQFRKRVFLCKKWRANLKPSTSSENFFTMIMVNSVSKFIGSVTYPLRCFSVVYGVHHPTLSRNKITCNPCYT